MKLACLLIVCAFAVAAVAKPQHQFKFTPQDNSKYVPQISGGGGGSPKQGYDVGVNVQQKVFESANGRHSVDLTYGHAQHLGGPYGSSPPQRFGGASYTYKFG